MPPNHFESEVESFLEGSHGDRTHIKRADHHTVTPLCGTLLAFAGVCSVSGETDDTIASQIHLILVLFHRAKVSWVSWRRPEAPALVPTVTSRGAVSSMGATKFAQRWQNGPKRVFYGVPGEFFRECGWVGCLLGEFWRSPAP